tara:strand:+ start:20753 stop:21313 length:561 start_codon:yes stop_codon:yes gene_type:complete
MSNFTIHTEETAPEGSKALLAASRKQNGMLPNLHAVMAEAPGLLEAYQTIGKLFTQSSFTKDELTVVWQSTNVEHSCHYCVPAHTAIAKSMKVGDEISDALRNETPLPSPRLEALRTFTLAVVRDRGQVAEAELQAFFEAGYTKQQVFEVILGLSQKVMSNYTNHFAQTPVDAPFQPFAWSKTAAK